MLSGQKYIISSGGQTRQTATGGISLLMDNGDLVMEYRIMSTRRRWNMNLGKISTNQWFYLAATWHINGNLTGYIDGTWQNSTNSDSYSSETSVVISNMHIGKPNNAGTNTYFGEVTIDEWYFWDSVLTTKHIQNLYDSYLQGKFSWVFPNANCINKVYEWNSKGFLQDKYTDY